MHPCLPIACFVSAHGFGHAARACAVMNAIFTRWPYVRFEIFTTAPGWFFAQSLDAPHAVHRQHTDVGMVQTTPLSFDLDETISALDRFLPFDEETVGALAESLARLNCRMVICDISPLGIAAGKKAGVSTVLIENFTWDWIYGAYPDPRLEKHIDYLKSCFDAADHLVQARPVCAPKANALVVEPVSRRPRQPVEETRSRLGIGNAVKAVLITMGGIPDEPEYLQRLADYGGDIHFIVAAHLPGLPRQGQREKNTTLIPPISDFYHPDLVAASDAVIGKIGYSTLAEVYHAGVPFGHVVRPDFRESFVLTEFARNQLNGCEISAGRFHSGKWLDCLPELAGMPRKPPGPNGADTASGHICRIMACEQEILEIVDAGGCVVGAAPRKQVHGNCEWLHRVVHALVFDDQDRLLLQKRSMSKRVAPGRWDTSVGGHVDCGETVKDALFREMAEELGIRPAAPRFAYSYIHANAFESELVHTYVCQFNGPVSFNREEIDAVKFWKGAEIISVLGKGILSDNFEDEYQRYLQWISSV